MCTGTTYLQRDLNPVLYLTLCVMVQRMGPAYSEGTPGPGTYCV